MTAYSPGRIKIVSFLVLLFGLLIVSKLFLVQVIHGQAYNDEADRQYVSSGADFFDRGSIFFKNKDAVLVNAATVKSGFKVAIVPKDIEDDESTFEKLSSVVALDQASFSSRVSKKDDPYEEIASRLTKEEADKISEMKLPGVSIFKQKWRFYPGGELAANTLGFVGYKGDELSGRYGLERYYDDTLSRNKENLSINFFAEVFSGLGKTFFQNDVKESDVVTSIEPIVQGFFETELKDVAERYSSDFTGGIIMNPKTGAIYSMATEPGFDLNDFSKVSNPLTFGNPLVENVYEL